ncbi:MAG: diguanylate cyclase, partial [Pedobacter sp.]
MTTNTEFSKFFEDVHWLMDILQNIDAGLVVMDKEYKVSLWNSFMQNHSGKPPEDVLQKSIFAVFPELSETWFKHKAQSVFVLQNAAFTTWEQRPYLFRFPHYRPITGTAEHMYQNSTIIPLIDSKGHVEHVCLIVYDVTDTAVNKLAQQQANKQLQSLSRTDHLTGLFNRGYWELRLIQEFKRFDRYDQPSSLIMLDIDHFKKVNDNYGHTVGDDVIRQVSRAIKEQVRDLDIAGRYGGEEFGIILTNTDAKGGAVFAERLRSSIEKMTVYSENNQVKFTISLGISQLNSHI